MYFNINLQVPLGIQIATSIRIGQYMGSGSKDGAITAARLGILAVCTYTGVMNLNLIVLKPLLKVVRPSYIFMQTSVRYVLKQ